MEVTRAGGWLIVIGVVFLILSLVLAPVARYTDLEPLMLLFQVWWLFLIAGIVLLIIGRRPAIIARIPTLRGLSFRRHDIMGATNWARIGKVELLRPMGVCIALSGLILLLVEIAFEFTLSSLWFILIVVGVVLAVLVPRSIEFDHTKNFLLRIPNIFSIHTFHTLLRHSLEDLGYIIVEELSPIQGSSPSSLDKSILPLSGGIRVTKRSYPLSKLLIPELSEMPIIRHFLTVFGIGLFLSLLGFSLIVHSILTPYAEWAGVILVIGLILLILGSIILVYDRIKRAARFAEIYILEDGTIHVPTINLYEPRALRSESIGIVWREPNFSVKHASCEVIVTIGALRNRFFDKKELEEDFNKVVSALETRARESSFALKEILTALS